MKLSLLSLLAAVDVSLTLSRLVETQAVIRIGHNCLPALEVGTQHKWIAFHPRDYGLGFHSNLKQSMTIRIKDNS